MINTSKKIDVKRMDERHYVELPLLEQLKGLGWEVLDLDNYQSATDSYRTEFTQVVLLPRLRDSLLRINPWLADDQVEEMIRRIIPATGSLLENNQLVLDLMLHGTPLDENRQTGALGVNAYYIDFENLEQNEFLAICQFKVRVIGSDRHIIPDIVCFINGLPVAVIECKSTKAKEPIPEAIDQLLRYSESREADREGNRSLFYYNQFVVATNRNEARFGTITGRSTKHFYRWSDPYPMTLDEIRSPGSTSAPNDQQRLVAGMFAQRNLLDLIRTFTLFTDDESGRRIKTVGRYQQFRAVKKAVAGLLAGTNKAQRSGIVWHTQGSGKSLTMVYLVRELYLYPELRKWKVVFVTDRTQLEDQLSGTAQAIGKSVQVADSIKRLKELLPTDSSDLVMAMIHKFQEKEFNTIIFPELNVSPHILILSDEAHRSQYGLLAANLDRALPNATEIAFTGTPIDKTEKKYGDYIDKYTMRDAIGDGVTLEIVYEGRTNNAEIPDQKSADRMFEDVFSEYNIDERLQILGYGSRAAYLEAEDVIAAKARDMIRHYTENVLPNGFKAQVVASSREAAHRYGVALDKAITNRIAELEAHNPLAIDLDRLRQIRVAVIISGGGHNDLPHLKAHADERQHKNDIRSFKMSFDAKGEDGISGEVGILVVNEMLLTGFDAPIEQVLYIDKVLQAHNLLQAIARVNRVGPDGKDVGFVVDYIGIGHHLKRALEDYFEREHKESIKKDVIDTISNPDQELAELKATRDEVRNLLAKSGVTDLGDFDAYFDIFYDEETRYEYILAFRKLTRAFNIVMPRKEALDYLEDYLRFSEINVQAAAHLRDSRFSMKGIPEKLRHITDAHLRSKGIEEKVAPISIMDEKFMERVSTRRREKTKAAEIEHAVRDHITTHHDDDPDLYASFAEALAAIIEQFRDDWERIRQELEKLRERLKNLEREPTYGLHRKKQMPILRILKNTIFNGRTLTDDEVGVAVPVVQEITSILETELRLAGFWNSMPARQRLKGEILKVILSPEYENRLPGVFDKRNEILSAIVEMAEKYNDFYI